MVREREIECKGERTSGILPGPESCITYREIDLLLYNMGKSLLMVIAFNLMNQSRTPSLDLQGNYFVHQLLRDLHNTATKVKITE